MPQATTGEQSKVHGKQEGGVVATHYSLFVERWQSCTACELHESRQNVVLARGQIPCDVLFLGEAPGQSEDCLSFPFVGPAGQLLDNPPPFSPPGIVQRAGLAELGIRSAFANLVCCIPLGDDGVKVTEPPDEAIEACSVRLVEFVEIANPRLIVCVGKLAKDWLDPGYKHSIKLHRRIPLVEIVHPAHILRMNYAQQGLAIQRATVVLRNAVEDVLCQK